MRRDRIPIPRLAAPVVCVAIAAVLAVRGAQGGPGPAPADPNGRPDEASAGAPRGAPQERPRWHDDPNAAHSQDAKALEILRAGIKALGGEEAILGRKSIFVKRKVVNHDYPEPREGTITLWYKRPDKIRKEVSYPPDPTRIEGFDGQNAWYDDGTGPRTYSQTTRTAAIRDGMQELDLPVNYLDAELTYFNISQEIPGKLAHVVKVRKNGYTKELLFDVSTYLLQVSGQYENPWGADDKMTRFDRYRPVDGVLVPYREERWRANRMVTETEILEIRFNGPIDDALFQVPAGATSSKP